MGKYCYSCREVIAEDHIKLHGLHEECFLKEFNISTKADFTDVSIEHQASGADPKVKNVSRLNTSFFHGKFRKYSASLLGTSYILKMKERDYEELPVTEYLSNQIAVQIGLNVPKFCLIEFENSITAFVTRNFMQDYTASNLVHLYHFTNDDETNWNCEFLINVIKSEIGKLKDIERFVELCLFDALIGNNDRHGRNLAFINKKQKYMFSPIYDNPSNIGVELKSLLGAHLEPRGSIATSSTDKPTMKDYVLEFRRLGYSDVCKRVHLRVTKEKARIRDLIDNSFLSEERKQALKKLMNRRFEELVENVK